MHIQVGANEAVDTWRCPNRSDFVDGKHVGYKRPAGEPVGYPRSPIVGGDFLLGEFEHADGRKALALVNWQTELSAMATVKFANATVNASDPSTRGWPLLYEIDQRVGSATA